MMVLVARTLLAMTLLCLLFAGCTEKPAPDQQRQSYGGGAFVQGGTCFVTDRRGKMVRVAPENCPSLRQKGSGAVSTGGTE